SLFGGKPALVRALYLEAFRRFAARLAAVPAGPDPAEDLVRLGIAYRDSALADPHLYAVMFGRAVPEFTPEPPDTEASLAAMSPLVDAVRAGVATGALLPVAPEVIAISLWGNVHGLVSLELSGRVPDGFDVPSSYELAIRASVRGWTTRHGAAQADQE